MGKVSVGFNSKEEVKLVYEVMNKYLGEVIDGLEFDDSFENRKEITDVFRVCNSLASVSWGEELELSLYVFFEEDFTIDTSFVDEDRLVFNAIDTTEIQIRVYDITKYEVIDGDVIVYGCNQCKNFEPALMIIEEKRWKSILVAIEENK